MLHPHIYHSIQRTTIIFTSAAMLSEMFTTSAVTHKTHKQHKGTADAFFHASSHPTLLIVLRMFHCGQNVAGFIYDL